MDGRRVGGPRVETSFTQAVEEELARAKVLDTEKRRVKFNKDLVITSKLVDRYEIFFEFEEHEEDFAGKIVD